MNNKLSPSAKKPVNTDWFVRGVLTKIGEIFDRLTGRNWQPSSSLATSELSEKLKFLLDSEVKDEGGRGKYVPHNIKLLMQWDKFSTDAEESMKKLEYELLTAAIDHINDRRYQTFAPLNLEIKPDYFTEGVKLMASYDKFAEEKGREAAVNVTVPDLKNVILNPVQPEEIKPEKKVFVLHFTASGKLQKTSLAFGEKERKSVGRTKENDLAVDDASISKNHAALVLNSEQQLMVADTGSTNGTFINGERIAYGRAFVIKDGDKLKVGTIDIDLEHIENEAEDFSTNEDVQIENPAEADINLTKKITVSDFDNGTPSS